MNQLKKKFASKKEESGMKQSINEKAEKVKAEVKQKGEEVLKWVLTVIYSALVIYFVFKPLTEFMVMLDYYIKVNIIKYFFN
jgi:hypothetical protein